MRPLDINVGQPNLTYCRFRNTCEPPHVSHPHLLTAETLAEAAQKTVGSPHDRHAPAQPDPAAAVA